MSIPRKASKKSMDIQGMRIVVTGGAQGLGRRFAEQLAQVGARVLTVDVRADESGSVGEVFPQGSGGLTSLRADVTSTADLARVARWVSDHWHGLDGLVNNAAIYEGLVRRPFDEIPVEEWDKVMAVNVKGVWLGIRALAPAFTDGGSIVNMASEVALTGSHGFPHYVASKGAVIALTRALARELGPRGIRVNAVAPGFTDTPASRTVADVDRYDVNVTPLRRVATPDDLVGTVQYLLSSASRFVTGQTILVNGGRTM